MAEEQKEPKENPSLWIFSRRTVGANASEVAFEPSDAIYHLYRQTRNPYVERAIAPTASKLERSPEDLHKLFRLLSEHHRYRIAASNDQEPYRRRELPHPPPPPSRDASYLEPRHLSGDLVRLPWMIEVFFQAVLSRLKADPGDFATVVRELMEELARDKVRIKIYDAYRTFQDWHDLMETLEEISRYPAPETFDLFCSALLAYYDLVYPPRQ